MPLNSLLALLANSTCLIDNGSSCSGGNRIVSELYEKSPPEGQSETKSDQSPKPLTKAKEYLRAIVEMEELENSDLSPDQVSAILAELGEVRDVIQSKFSVDKLSKSAISDHPVRPIEETLQEILLDCLRGDSRHVESSYGKNGMEWQSPYYT